MTRHALSGLLRSRRVVALAAGLAIAAGTFAAREAGWLVSWELSAFDSFLRLRDPLESEPPVAMVWVREEEITKYGHPMPDGVMAEALRSVLSQGPSAVGVDIYRDKPVGEGWDRLREVFLANRQVVIVEKLPVPSHPGVGPPPFLPDRSQVGFSDVMIDRDGVSRRGLLMLWDDEGAAYLSLSLQLALRHAFAEGLQMTQDPERPDFVRLGETTVPPFTRDLGAYQAADDGGYQYLLDYRRANGSFPSANLTEVLDGDVPPDLFRDRVVLIGTASPSVKDYFQTPSGLVQRDDALVYGAEHHAHAVDQLVRYARGEAAPITSPSETWETVWIFAWCLLGALVGLRVRSPLSWMASVVAVLAVVLAGGFWAFTRGWWIPVVPAAGGSLASLALLVAHGIQQERADKEKMRNLFGRYASRRLVDRVWELREVFMEGGRPKPLRITVTVMLTDLIGYTSTSETKEPAEVMSWIGTYMDRMAQLIEEHGGMVNDFLGDGIMASFGVPLPSTSDEEIARDASDAVECALAMGEALEELNARWRANGLPTARMRAGILTGPAVVGEIGSEDRMKYATVGNTVNTASRLESFDKMSFEVEPEQSTNRVLIGQATLDRLGDRFVTKCLGDHRLKGKGRPVTIHRVLARSRDVRPA